MRADRRAFQQGDRLGTLAGEVLAPGEERRNGARLQVDDAGEGCGGLDHPEHSEYERCS
ncbi:MAG: hypothetical protein M5U07_18775 [Xanthobacteraceae bacterium]|nr:hypothetical protein [Xanthobacteraceae bacterium]